MRFGEGSKDLEPVVRGRADTDGRSVEDSEPTPQGLDAQVDEAIQRIHGEGLS